MKREDLFNFQMIGGEWLAEKTRRYLADYMGIGKTRQAAYAARLVEPRHPAVVLCPAIAQARWRADWGLVGPKPLPLIMSYDKLVRGASLPNKIGPLILDEAHRLKNHEAKRTQIVLGKSSIFERAEQVWLLSGTPTPNHPAELFTVLARLWPERLRALNVRSRLDFLNLFCYWRVGDYGIQVFGVKNPGLLQELLYGPQGDNIMLRRNWDSPDVLREMATMPRILWRHEPISVPIMPNRVTNDVVAQRMIHALEAGAPPPDENTAKLLHEVGKLKAPKVVEALQDEMENEPGRAIVVYARHLDVLDILQDGLKQFGVARVDGRVKDREREERVEAFQMETGPRVFLGQIEACRESLTLTRAAQVELVEWFWSPEYNNQLAARIRRHGQRAAHLIARMWGLAGSFDDIMAGVLVRKTSMLASTLNHDPVDDDPLADIL